MIPAALIVLVGLVVVLMLWADQRGENRSLREQIRALDRRLGGVESWRDEFVIRSHDRERPR